MNLSCFAGKCFTCVAAATLLLLTSAGSIQAQTAGTIEYETVEQVFDALQADENAARTDYAGWIVYNIANNGSYTLWSITPEDHPANPTAIRRDVVSRDGKVSIAMSSLCQAEKPACDALIAEFEEINASIKKKMENGGNG